MANLSSRPTRVCTTREISTHAHQEFRNLLFLPNYYSAASPYPCLMSLTLSHCVCSGGFHLPRSVPPDPRAISLYVLTRSRDLMRARYADHHSASLARMVAALRQCACGTSHVVRGWKEGRRESSELKAFYYHILRECSQALIFLLRKVVIYIFDKVTYKMQDITSRQETVSQVT